MKKMLFGLLFCLAHYTAAGAAASLYEQNPWECKVDGIRWITSIWTIAFDGSIADLNKTIETNSRVDLDEADNTYSNGNTPLHLAALSGRLEMWQELIKRGASTFNTPNLSGEAPLHSAVAGGCLDIVHDLLCNHGADVNTCELRKNTPLHTAALKGHVAIAAELIHTFGAIVDVPNLDGNTALHIAVREGHLPVVQLLTKAGANVNATNRYGETPLHLAAINDRSSIAWHLLLSTPPAIIDNPTAYRKSTPLHCAASCHSLKTVRILCALGANAGIKNEDGNTPVDMTRCATIKAILQCRCISTHYHPTSPAALADSGSDHK